MRRDRDCFSTIGFWSEIPLLLVTLSGVVISYQWLGRWLDRALGSPKERAAAISASASSTDGARTGGDTRRGAGVVGAPTASVASYLHTAVSTKPDWSLVTITLPTPDDTTATVAVADGNSYRPDLRTTRVLDLADARVLRTRDYASLTPSRKIRAWVRFGHTVKCLACSGQTIATIVCAGGAVLVYTGIALSWRRFMKWRAR